MSKRFGGSLIFFSAGISCLPLLRAQDAQQPTPPPAAPAAEVSAPLPPRADETQTQAPSPIDTRLKQREQLNQPPTPPNEFRVDSGTRILLNMINSVSTKSAMVGDRIYLETAFPVMASGRIVVPQGSWVTGTVVEVKRPGRVKGRGELSVRFDSLTLPNGVSRNFHAGLGGLDGRAEETLDREHDAIKSAGNKQGDTNTVIDTTLAGAGIGAAAGAAAGHVGGGAGIGLAAGAAAGLIGVLVSRGPDAMLTRGTNVEMVLDRPLEYQTADLDFSHAPPSRALTDGQGPQQTNKGGFRRPNP
jgi:hypothetical protein